ncbi:MAG: SOS response-associated peptidase [Firmicutes bacterium]|nr:SOS response-associated peptidase [Bacillota bacterium]
MCGRFTLINWQEMAERFGVSVAIDFIPRYNITPTQQIPVIVNIKRPEIRLFRWGLIPSWVKDTDNWPLLINAKAETITKKKSFCNSFKYRRCLIPADGFYEWKREGKKKIPYRFSLKNKSLFAFAGLWDYCETEKGKLYTCTIITTGANELVAEFHNRMPVILKKDAEAKWLDVSSQQTDALKELLLPYPAAEMEVAAVNPLVNKATIDSPEILST